MAKRIAILGANGQVASEVTLLLRQLGADIVPVCRGQMGASFLRYMGIPVRIGSIGKEADAGRLLADADIVANFALALGTGREARDEHDRILRNTLRHAKPGASVLFFSTLSVNDFHNATGARKGAYGAEKLRNERFFTAEAKRLGRPAMIVRLGHVCGEYQNITGELRSAVCAGPVQIPDPSRHANCIATATIADLLMGIAEGRILADGAYDLVNEPRWDWNAVIGYEAGRSGCEARIEEIGTPSAPRRGIKDLARSVLRLVASSPTIRPVAERVVGRLAKARAERIKGMYLAQRAASEIAALDPQQPLLDAPQYPARDTRVPPGLQPTAELLANPAYVASREPLAPSWPSDI